MYFTCVSKQKNMPNAYMIELLNSKIHMLRIEIYHLY